MCIRDRARRDVGQLDGWQLRLAGRAGTIVALEELAGAGICLLYTSDAADELLCVDLGGRRIIKKKNHRVISIDRVNI